MAKQAIGIGSAPNDGTGDTLRVAFDKVNDNFDEVYSAFTTFASNNATFANNLLTGNSTVNAIINSVSMVFSGNTTINSTTFKVGNSTVNAVVNSSALQIVNMTLNGTQLSFGNSTINAVSNSSAIRFSAAVGNTVVNSTTIFIGNSTINVVANSSTILISNNLHINSTELHVGNSTVNAFMNSSSIQISNQLNLTSDGLKVGLPDSNTTPSRPLHVTGSNAVVGYAQLMLEGRYNAYGVGVTFQSRTSAGGTLVEMARIVADGQSSWTTTAATQDAKLSFYTTEGGTSAVKMVILANGNIGVSNSTPTNKLHVTGNVRMSGIRIDIAPSVNVVAASTHTVPVDLNGTTYHVLVAS